MSHPEDPPERDEYGAFREAVGPVRPVRNDRVVVERPRPRPVPRKREEDERAVVDELLSHPWDPAALETGEELLHARPGIQHRVLRRLRRGQYSVGAELDLHHMNAEAAQSALADFIDESRGRLLTCVKVIHGKGLRSRAGGPVLKRLVSHWLRRHPAVMAFASARANDGGTGAVYVLLKR